MVRAKGCCRTFAKLMRLSAIGHRSEQFIQFDLT